MEKNSKKRIVAIWISSVVCLCIIAGGVLGYRHYKAEHPWPVIRETVIRETGEEIAVIPRWEDMTIYEQYTEIELDGKSYTAGKGKVPETRIGELLGRIEARGWDEYVSIAGENPERYINADVYAITDISEECAVAVQYEGTDTRYVCLNSYYRPETLGQFIEDTNLDEEVQFGYVWYDYRTPSGNCVNIRFENLDSTKVWELLLSAEEAVNEYDEFKMEPDRILGISVDIPLLGYENISLSVREDGYIVTNILNTGKMFYVGEENTQTFVDYVLTECDGYEIVYDYENAEPIPE
ncbi:MAG: hypothetical protein E7456_02040 [Ruminococcaceae bacterium]|nr:hypothetical protein [Oscillospiraceae bacterium]